MKKLNILFLISLWIAGLLHTPAGAFSLALNADQVIENNGGYWVNPEYSYQEDTLYASVLGSANGARYLRLGLENPVLDTTNIKITGVTIYVKAYSSYSKTKARIQPYFNDIAGLESGNLNIGTSEVLRSYDITNQRSWTWQDLNELSIRFTPKTAAYFYINYIFAVVNYTDSTVLGDYTFQFSAISSPETLGYYFPVTIIALDSLGDTATSYNGNASLSDSTGTITPINVPIRFRGVQHLHYDRREYFSHRHHRERRRHLCGEQRIFGGERPAPFLDRPHRLPPECEPVLCGQHLGLRFQRGHPDQLQRKSRPVGFKRYPDPGFQRCFLWRPLGWQPDNFCGHFIRYAILLPDHRRTDIFRQKQRVCSANRHQRREAGYPAHKIIRLGHLAKSNLRTDPNFTGHAKTGQGGSDSLQYIGPGGCSQGTGIIAFRQ